MPASKRALTLRGVEVDPEDLFLKVLSPSRPRLTKAREAAKDIADTEEAWEVLASRDVIPMDWVGASTRWFTAEEPPAQLAVTDGQNLTPEQLRRYLDEGPAVTASPPTVEACVTLASDPEGVVTAEALALEAMRALAPWGAPQPAVVAWRCIRPATWKTAGNDWRHQSPAVVAWEAASAVRYREKAPFVEEFDFGTPEWRAASAMDSLRAWEAAARKGADITEDHRREVARRGFPEVPKALVGRSLASLADPFEPLLALWNTGYGFDAITATAVVLVAPLVREAW